MQRIEDKIRKLFLRMLSLVMGAVLLLAAVSLAFMWKKSMKTFGDMSTQSAEELRDVLTVETSRQAEQYADACGEIIDQKFLQTAEVMRIIERQIEEIYEFPERYVLIPYENAARIIGEGRQMQWLLPEGEEDSEGVYEEIFRLGNITFAFEECTERNSQIQRIYFTSASGVNIGYDADYEKKPEHFEGRERAWYVDAVQNGEMVLSDAYVDSFLNRLTVTLSIPCYDEDQELLGVLAADILIDDLERMIHEMNLEFGGYAVLVSESGSLVAAQGMTIQNSGDTERFLGSAADSILDEWESGDEDVRESTIDGEEKYIISSKLGVADWKLCLILDQEEFNRTAKEGTVCLEETAKKASAEMKWKLLFTCAAYFVCAAVIFLAVSRHSGRLARTISEPIEKLTEDAQRIGSGKLSYKPDIHTNDEVEELSRAFASMTQSLEEYIRNLSRMSAEKERMETELHVATQIQESMLPCIFPAFPERRDMDIYARMKPAKEVGGDFYDFFLVDENRLCIVMADVSGKGIPAALFMVVAKTLLKDNLLSGNMLREAMERVNGQLCENNEAGMFVTVFAGCLDLAKGRMEYVNAGHNPPLLIRKEKREVQWISRPSGFVMAGLREAVYEEGTVMLRDGDILFAYTDGVTEAQNEAGELYGEERLTKLWENGMEGRDARKMTELVMRTVENFTGEAQQSDDITMLTLVFRPKGTGRSRISLKADREELPVLQEFLAGLMEERKVSDEWKFWVALAAEEVFVNIADYAYKDMGEVSEHYVEAECGWEGRDRETPEKFCMVFRDAGVQYDPLEQEEPDLTLDVAKRPIGGLGIYLVRNSMDEAEYEYRNGENVLRLAKYL